MFGAPRSQSQARRPEGGRNNGQRPEICVPTTDTWLVTGSMAVARFLHTATLLSYGRVLITGGSDGLFTASAELFTP